MRILVALLLIGFCSSSVNAELFKSDNLFPAQTAPQSFNNLYESDQSVILNETEKKKKAWWRIKEDTTETQTETKSNFKTINEGIKKDNFNVLSD